jgi:hypothetical protein
MAANKRATSKFVIAVTGPPNSEMSDKATGHVEYIVKVVNMLKVMGHSVALVRDSVLPDSEASVASVPRSEMGLDGEGCVNFYNGKEPMSSNDSVYDDIKSAKADLVLLDVALHRLASLAGVIDLAIIYSNVPVDTLAQRFIDIETARGAIDYPDLTSDEYECDLFTMFVAPQVKGSQSRRQAPATCEDSLKNYKWVRLYYKYVVKPEAVRALENAMAEGVWIATVNANAEPDEVCSDIVASVIYHYYLFTPVH